MKINGYLLFAIILCIALTTVGSQEVDNRVFDISMGKDILPFFQVEVVSGNSRILLWDDHGITSKWYMVLDDKKFVFKNTNWHPIQRINDQTYVIFYEDEDFDVEQRLEFSSNFHRCRIIFRFTGSLMHKIQPILLLDTHLGEAGNTPFRVSGVGVITRETEFIKRNIPERVSLGSDEIPLTLEIDPTDNVTPNRMVMANYFRLSSRPFDYVIDGGRDFNTLYHKENDSALLLEFTETVVMPDQRKDFVISFSLNGVNSDDMSAISQPAVPADQERVSMIQDYLRAIEAVIESIDTLQSNPSGIDENSISDIEKQVLEQERLRTEYENLQ